MKKSIILLLGSLILLLGCTPGATPFAASAPQETGTSQTQETELEENEARTPEATGTEEGQETSSATEESQTQAQEPFPPFILSSSPQTNEEVSLETPIEIVFDQPMNSATVEEAFSITPSDKAQGSFEWIDERTVHFTLADGLERGETYQVQIAAIAESDDGLSMNRPFELRFKAAGFLEVSQVQPSPEAVEVTPETVVTVFFNRPVVALNALSESEVNPLTFEPAIEGSGEWLNTATYQFTPDGEGFDPATEYTARVSGDLTDLFGQAVMADDYEWRFRTVSPAVVASIPSQGDIFVSSTPVISVAFNQLMDHESVEQNFQLVDSAGESINGQFSWVEMGVQPPGPQSGGPGSEPPPFDPGLGAPPLEEADPVGVETVRFTPDGSLDLGQTYNIVLASGVNSLREVETQNGYEASFTVIPAPQVTQTTPEDGEQFAEVWGGVEVAFNAPMDPSSAQVGENLLVESNIEITEVYTNWMDNNTRLGLGFPFQENQSYTVTVGADITSRDGQPLGETTTFSWKTLRQSPYVRLVSPKIATYNGYHDETYVYMTVRNVSRVQFELYRLSSEDFLKLVRQPVGRGWESSSEWEQFQPEETDLIGQWDQTTDPENFVNYVYKVDVSEAAAEGDPLAPGLYYLESFSESEDFYPEAEGSEPNATIDRQVLIVSQRTVTLKKGQGDALVWLTDLQSGDAVPGASLTFFGPDRAEQTGETDEDGIALFDFEQPSSGPFAPVIVFAGDPDQPDENFAVGSTDWNAGIGVFEFDYLSDFFRQGGGRHYGGTRDYKGAIYTDRSLYRPGQTIYFKGIIRADDDAFYTIPTQSQTVEMIIRDSSYQEIYNEDITLSEVGTLNGSFDLDEEAGLGDYTMELRHNMTEQDYGTTAYWSFKVAEYRKPEYLVEATTDKDAYRQGETIEVTVETEYFFGGPVADAEVRWTALSDDYYFQGPLFYDFTNEDNSRSQFFNPNYGYGFGEQIANGTGTTDGNGRFTIELPADISGRLISQIVTFDIAITGLNNQEVATQVQTIVHKGDFYVGLRPVEYIGQIGVENEIELLVVDWKNQPVANQEVEVILAREEWYSVQRQDTEGSRLSADDQFYWENLVDQVAIETVTVTTDEDGQAIATFTPESGGSHKIYAHAVDGNDQDIYSSTFIWVSGQTFVNWGQENSDRIELVADQTEYNTGDTANILVPHPYSSTVTALVTVERGHIYESFITELENNSEQVEIEITEDMSPNAYVSVMVIQGMEEAPDDVPSFKLGYARLNVDLNEKLLNIALTPNQTESYRPGDVVEYQVKVSDFQGNPVEAELSLALIDKAVLSLMPYPEGQLSDVFWSRRWLEVDTSTALTLALDRVNRALDERKGGGGGGNGPGPDSIRQNFADTAFWEAEFTTNAEGEGSFEVTLPDNLTTWVLIAKGFTEEEPLVGEARHEIVTNKPLLVRPITPRFFVVGDQVDLGMIVQNIGSDDLTVAPSVEIIQGLEISEWRIDDSESWQPYGETDEIAVDAGEEIKIEYRTTVLEAKQAQLEMAATATEFQDAIAIDLPIYRLSAPETVATVGVLAEAGTRLEGIALPQIVDSTQGELTVEIEPSLAAGMRSGLDYLEHYEHESTEQTISRFLPNLMTYQAYQELGIDNPELEEKLPRLVNIALQRLFNQRAFDGGWGWWPGEPSDPFLTAYALLGLVEAKEAGFTVEDWNIDSGVDYLNQNLMTPKDVTESWQANRQAFMLYVLAKANRPDLSRSVTLFEQREQLDMFGRAYLAMALDMAEGDETQIETLLNDINNAAVTSATGVHWQEREIDYFAMNSDIRSTAVIITALARLQSDNPHLPQAVRWLMTAREQKGHWSTTQETAWAIIGLTEWLKVSEELAGDYDWQVSLNGTDLESGSVDAANLEETTQLQVAAAELIDESINRLAIEREGGESGRLYYGAYLTYFLPAEEVKALDRGIIVSRQYTLQGEDEPITEAQVGDFIEVKLTLIAPTNLYYVAIEDYLPAGTEVLDSSLATTSLMAGRPQLRRIDEGRSFFTHTDLRDEKAVIFATSLPQGAYEYTYTIRASLPGVYQAIPTHAEQTYFPEVFGRSEGAILTITP